MTTWIFAVLALYLAQIYLSATLFLPTEGLLSHLGGRDHMPDKGKFTARADRALANLKENLPLFLVPALLTYVVPETDMATALLGAQIFFWGRLAYVPAYLFGTPGPRSIAYGVGFFGNLMMVWALIG